MRRLLLRIADQIGLLGFGVFLVSALGMIGLWVVWMLEWLGWPGLLLGVVTAPLASVFPFVYWAVEGVFSWPYFAFWAAGVVGVGVSMGRGLLPSE